MFALNQRSICLVAILAVQVLSTFASRTGGDDTEALLVARGLYDLVTDPIGTVDNRLRSVRTAGRNAVLGTVGKGLELATGVNPLNIIELPKNAAKTAIRGARRGAVVAADAADRTLDKVLDIHDVKKQLLEDYVIPVAPTMVGSAINRVHDGFDSTVGAMKDRVQDGKDHVVGKLNALEDWVHDGGAGGSTNVGKDVAGAASGWLGSWVPGWSGSAAGETEVNQGQPGARPGRAAAGAGSGQNVSNAAAAAKTGLSRFLPWGK